MSESRGAAVGNTNTVFARRGFLSPARAEEPAPDLCREGVSH